MAIEVTKRKLSGEDYQGTRTYRGIVRFNSNSFDVANGLVDLLDWAIGGIVGDMLDGNTESFINVTYQSSDNTIDFEVAVKDEDDMASNSANHVPTQQSVKAYVDSMVSVGTYLNIDGGAASGVYSPMLNIEGGSAASVFGGVPVTPIDCGGA